MYLNQFTEQERYAHLEQLAKGMMRKADLARLYHMSDNAINNMLKQYMEIGQVKKWALPRSRQDIIKDGKITGFGSYMKLHGVDVKQFSKKIGTSDSAVYSWMYGMSVPRMTNIRKIASAIGMSEQKVVSMFTLSRIEAETELHKEDISIDHHELQMLPVRDGQRPIDLPINVILTVEVKVITHTT